MKKANLLSKAEMKNVIGGVADLCAGKTGADLTSCRYNVCMSGWDFNANTEEANKNKIDSCCAISGDC